MGTPMYQPPRAPRLKARGSTRDKGMAEPPKPDEDSPSARTARFLRFVLAEERPAAPAASEAAPPASTPLSEPEPSAGVPPAATVAAWLDAVAEAVKEADERWSQELSAARGRVLIAEERARVAEERERAAEERADFAEQRAREAEERAGQAETRAEEAEAALRRLYDTIETQGGALRNGAAEGEAEDAGRGR
jgi:hypothetical protein